MDKYELESRLTSVITEYLAEQHLELVELTVRRQGPDMCVKVLADRPEGGISLSECAGVNRQLTRIIEEGSFFPGGYAVEVSSPGLDRPLTTKNDFSRCRGRRVQVFLREQYSGKFEYGGSIEGVDEEAVLIKTQDQVVRLPLSVISKAKQTL
jgi:ribosome maturation factor RimP